jgi:hypothetical protein
MKTILIKKLVALCSLIFLFSTVYAQQFTLQSVSGNPGQSVTVSLNITQAIPNAGAITVFFQFNEAVLAYSTYSIVMPEAAGTLVNKYPGQPKVGIAWSATNNGVNFPTGTMLTVTFTVLNCNSSALNFLPSQCEIVDWDVNPINVTYVNGGFSNIPVASATWTGNGGNTNWGNPSNWNGGIVPTCGTNVTIPGGLISNPTIITPAFCNNITVESGASLITNAALTVSGTSTVKHDYTGGEWHLISSPVSGATANMFLGEYLQNHNEGTNLYTDIIDPLTSLNVMQGYAIWNTAGGTAEFMGSLNNGAIGTANNVTRSATGTTRGWNLVGNPYPSAIDWDYYTGWTKTNVENATYRHVDAATWASYVGGVGINGGTRYIAPCQGFFVSVTDGQTTGTLNMNNSVRTHTSTPFFKDEVADIVRLEVSGNGYTDETVIRFLDIATNDFDADWDAHKLFGTVNEAPAIYCADNGMMAINSLPETNTVPVGVKTGVPGEFTITATEISEFSNVFLEDLLTDAYTDLKTGSYTFSYDMEFDNRFILHFTPMGVGEGIADQINIYSTQKDVFVNVPANTSGEIAIYNVMGQEITRTGINSTVNKVTLNESAYYVVKVMSNESVVTKKVFVR